MSNPLRRLIERRRVRIGGDDGFVLLESIVSISLITIIMTAMATFFVGALDSTAQQRARQVAAQLADSNVETIRGLPASDLLTGHDATSVSTQYSAAPSTVTPWLASMSQASSSSAAPGSGPTAAIPTIAVSQTVNNVVYTIQSYLGTCGIVTGSGSGDCTIGGQTGGIGYLRAVVAITWRDKVCANSLCTYVTATLISQDDDPTFNLNQTPPAVPVVNNPGNQTAAVGDTVSLQLTLQTSTGVNPISWAVTAGSLPVQLAMSPSGLISGVPTTTVSNLSVTVTVTDAFQRTASATFTWAIVPKLTVAAVADQASVVGTAISTLTLTASGGNASPYTWSDPGNTLPPGLAISTVNGRGKVTGTPSSAGLYPVQIRATDSSGTHTGTVSFTWNVTYPPLAATNPGIQIDTLNQSIGSIQLAASGGSGNYVWSGGATLPAGLSLSSGGLITGTPTARGTTSVTLDVTDTLAGSQQTIAFSWKVVARPTVSSPGAIAHTVGATFSLALTSSCPNSPCTYTVNSGPATLTINPSGVLSGTVTSAAQTFSSVSITVKDADGATATSGTFTFTVNPAPAVSNPGTQTVYKNTSVSLDAATLVSGGTGSFTYSANNLPSWLSIDSSTGLITGTAPPTTGDTVTSNITITATDADGMRATSGTFKWIVSDLAVSIGDQTTYTSTAVSIDLDSYTAGGVAPYTFSITNKPSWLTYSPSTHVLSATASATPSVTTTTTGIVVTATDSSGATLSSSTFRWNVTTLKWATIGNRTSTQGTAIAAFNAAASLSGTTPGNALTFRASGLPNGLSISKAGVITGTPTVSGIYMVTLSVTDNLGATVSSNAFTWTI